MSAEVCMDNHTREIVKEGVESKKTTQKCCRFPTRYTVILLNLFGVLLSVVFDGILSVAMVKMVKTSGERNSHVSNQITNQNGEFDWSKQLQGTILTAFLLGYGFGCVCGGRLGEVFGIKRILGTSICVSSILTLLTPLAASISTYLLFSLRLVMGYCSATTIPYRAIVTSVPMWAAIFANIGEAWGQSTIGVNLPLYLAHSLHFEVSMTGLLAALPFLFQGITMWFSGYLADILINKGKFNKTLVRKIMNSSGQLLAGMFLLLLTFVGPNRATKVALLTTGCCVNGFISAGFKSAFVDMAPSYSGSICGFSMFFGFLVSFISPYVVGYVTSHYETDLAWNIVFWITAGFFIMGGLVFVLGGSAESQPWGLTGMEVSDETPRNRIELKATSRFQKP